MTEHVEKRITIVAAIVTILSALWYMLRPNSPAAQVLVEGATASPSGRVSDPVLFGAPGSRDQVVARESPTAAAVAAVNGTAGADGMAGAPGAAGMPNTAYLFYNQSPRNIPAKAAGGCGCERPACTAQAPSNLFPDGRGSCLSSTQETLTRSIENCRPGITRADFENMLSNMSLYGGADWLQ